jgi:hypothetical protein
VLCLLATLPLLWQSLATTPWGTLRIFHLGALALLLVARPQVGAFREVRRAVHPLGPALLAFTFILTTFGVLYHDYWVNPVQNYVYAYIGLYAGACFLTALRHEKGRAILVWAAPVTLVTFLAVFGRSMQAAGVDPIAAYRQAILGHRNVILHEVFRRVFSASAGEDQDVLSQARHEVYGALLVAGCISAMVLRGASGLVRLGIAVCELVIFMLILTSLSRAVMVGAALLLLLFLVRVLLRGHIPVPALLTGLGVLAAMPFLMRPIMSIVIDRFLYDTESYEGRASAWRAFAAPDTVSRLVAGGGPLERSTHTMIGDALLHGGLAAGLAAIVLVFGVLVRIYCQCAGWWLARRDFAALAAAGAVGMATVRTFTSGGGLLHLAMWSAVGLTAAFVVTVDARDRAAWQGRTSLPQAITRPLADSRRVVETTNGHPPAWLSSHQTRIDRPYHADDEGARQPSQASSRTKRH